MLNSAVNLLGRLPSAVYLIAFFRKTAQEVEFSLDQFIEKPTQSGTLVRLTYDMIKDQPGLIAKLVEYEVVAPYPQNGDVHDKNGELHAELKRRFGHTNSDRIVFAIMDDKDAPPGHVPQPLSIMYGAFGDRLANTLSEITSLELGRTQGGLPLAVSFYSAINLSYKDEGRRKKLSAGIGAKQVEETRAWLKEKTPSLIDLGTLSPLIGYEEWLQTKATPADVAELDGALAGAAQPISLAALRQARLEGGAGLYHPAIKEATKRSIAVFLMRTQEKSGKNVPVDQAFGLHVSRGAVVFEVLVDDPADPRVRYYYPMDDAVLAGNAQRFAQSGVATVSAAFKNLLAPEMAKKVQVAQRAVQSPWSPTALWAKLNAA